MNKKLFPLFIFSFSGLTSCMTRAPSDFELDKQAGRIPKKSLNKQESTEEVYKVIGLNKDAKEPIKTSPRVEKIWLYDQETDSGAFLQGTYIYFQVDGGRWLNPGEVKQ